MEIQHAAGIWAEDNRSNAFITLLVIGEGIAVFGWFVHRFGPKNG